MAEFRRGDPRDRLIGMIGLQVKTDDLRKLSKALRAEEDGKVLRRDLLREIRSAAMPVREEMRAGIRAMSSQGRAHAGPSLRAGIARRVVVETRMAGRSAGIRIKAKKTPTLRGFASAAKNTNSAKGWRHPVMADRNNWVAQRGAPGWFDKPTLRNRYRFNRACNRALNSTASRIARKV